MKIINIKKEDFELFLDANMDYYLLLSYIKRFNDYDINEELKKNKKVEVKLCYKNDSDIIELNGQEIKNFDSVTYIVSINKEKKHERTTTITEKITLKDK